MTMDKIREEKDESQMNIPVNPLKIHVNFSSPLSGTKVGISVALFIGKSINERVYRDEFLDQ